MTAAPSPTGSGAGRERRHAGGDAGPGRAEIRAALAESRRLFASIALFSAFVNLLMLTGPLFMLQIYDRVLTSRSEATLVALAGLVAFLFLMMGLLDHARARVLARAGARFQTRMESRVLGAILSRAGRSPAARSAPATGLHDLEAMQRFASGPGPFAFFDAPWTPAFRCVLPARARNPPCGRHCGSVGLGQVKTLAKALAGGSGPAPGAARTIQIPLPRGSPAAATTARHAAWTRSRRAVAASERAGMPAGSSGRKTSRTIRGSSFSACSRRRVSVSKSMTSTSAPSARMRSSVAASRASRSAARSSPPGPASRPGAQEAPG